MRQSDEDLLTLMLLQTWYQIQLALSSKNTKSKKTCKSWKILFGVNNVKHNDLHKIISNDLTFKILWKYFTINFVKVRRVQGCLQLQYCYWSFYLSSISLVFFSSFRQHPPNKALTLLSTKEDNTWILTILYAVDKHLLKYRHDNTGFNCTVPFTVIRCCLQYCHCPSINNSTTGCAVALLHNKERMISFSANKPRIVSANQLPV